MSIKYKTLIISIISILLVIGITITIFYFSYFGYINEEREQRAIENFKVVDYIVENEEDSMQTILLDWGQWDDTYKFINDKNQEYIKSNFQGDSLENLKLTSMIFLDKNKNIIYSHEINEERELSDDLVKKLLLNDENFNVENQRRIGLISLKDKVYMIGIYPITSTDKQAESNGYIIAVHFVDSTMLEYIERIVPVALTIGESKEDHRKSDISYINFDDDNVITYNKKNYEASRIVKDINGDYSIEITINGDGYGDGNIEYFLKNFILEFLCLIAIIIIFDIIVVKRYILKRLLKLIKFIEKVATTKDTTLAIEIDGKDEIYKLGNALNNMLSQLNLANEEILFLSYCDKLTGLRNRAYMDNVFSELDKSEKNNYFIVMGDLNGLKDINNTLGGTEGDKILCLMGEILKENCEHDDIISRWAGDEFVILIKNKDESYVVNLIDKVKEICKEKKEGISIALGYAGYCEESFNAEAVISLAEKRMYRNKLMENKSPRSAIINSLLKTLHEKHSETEEHTLRMKNLSFKLGKRLGLTKEKLDELELLALLHDIGKIGVPEQILMKPSKLNDEEWAIMKRHSEIGYRIASSTPELAHIADKILAHHERYDGTGYPNQLKGNEIPLLSRIISIVDSFDVMTHKRVYKEAFSSKHVINELKRCSGTQFDPYFVKEFITMLEEEFNYVD